MELDDLKKFIQQHFTDGLVVVIGSGLSAAEGIPGMPALANHLNTQATHFTEPGLINEWKPIASVISAGEGLETALLKHPPSENLEDWIVQETCSLILPFERSIIQEVVSNGRELRLTKLLKQILKPSNGLPILTTNYDRLVEVACERAGFHVDTTAVGIYAAEFDHKRSLFMSCRGTLQRGKATFLDHCPRAVVLKPHGSFDWYRNGDIPLRCSIELDSLRAIITPGLNKYRAGYDTPFDLHRELANEHIRAAARLLVIGYGFNDDHLQTHLMKRINDGTPTLILTRTIEASVDNLASNAPRCVCVGMATTGSGVVAITKNARAEHIGPEFWDINVLIEEVLQ